MRIATLIIATLAIAAASTSSVEAPVPEDIVVEQFEPADIGLLQEHTFAEASNKLESLLQESAKGSQCITNAKKSISSVIHEVKNAQGILNRMDNGSRCNDKGKNLVNSAKISLARKQATEKAASKALNKAQNAKISVSVTFSSGNSNCNVFTSSASWQKARRNVNRKKNALTKAKQQVKDAQSYLRKMK